jgi:hypothetical protein
MARPRTYTEDRVATAVRLPVSVYRRLHQAAADRDVSANLLVTRAVTEFLNRLAPERRCCTGPPGNRGPRRRRRQSSLRRLTREHRTPQGLPERPASLHLDGQLRVGTP